MKRLVLPAAAAIAVALNFGTAFAAETSSTMSKSTSAATASDSLSLTSAQQKAAWESISRQAMKQTLPSSFVPAKGAVVPSALSTQPVPVEASNKVPSLRPYNYAMVEGKILIVNPTDKKVVDVIDKS